MNALLLMKFQPQDAEQIMHRLTVSEHEGVVRAWMIHGPFDCAVEIHAPTFEEINEIVARIRQIEGVTEVMTCLITHSWHSESVVHAG